MALVRTKLRRRAVAVAFVLATIVGIGAVSTKPASADTAMCGWVITTRWAQGGFQVDEPRTDTPIYLHTYLNGETYDIPWSYMLWFQYWGVWYPAWGSYFYIPNTDCWNNVS